MLVIWLLLVCACAWWWCRQWRLLRLTARMPTLPGALPIIGHALHLMGSNENLWNYINSVQYTANSQGGITKMWIGPSLFVVVTDPNLAQTLLYKFEEKAYVYDFAKSWVGKGLITADVSTWRHHRKLLNPTFNQHILDGYLEVFNENSDELVKKLKMELGRDEFDISPYIDELSMLNVFQTALGLSNAEAINKCNKEYVFAAHRMLEIIIYRLQNFWMHFSFIYNWTNAKKEEQKISAILKKMSSKVLLSKKTENNRGSEEKNKYFGRPTKGFLDYMLELQSEGLLTDREITEEVDTMIEAALDTSGTSLLIILILLASHCDVQDRVYNEIKEVLADSSDVNKKHLSQLVYMEAVIKEALRLYPIVPLIARNVNQNFEQGDIFLPSGSTLIVGFVGIHKNGCWGKDAENFRPERWFDGSLPTDSAAFAAFSLGRRNCIGKRFAMMSMKTALAHLIRRYRVNRQEIKLRLKWTSMLKPVAGHHISIQLRH